MDTLFFLIVLIMSAVVHEVAHGFAALYFGDSTALYAKRLTLNPLKHLDMFGSIILPAILALTRSPFMFGWAKPVPFNPDNFSNRRLGTIAVASAGVLTNLVIAIFFGTLIRFGDDLGLPIGFFEISSLIVMVNLGLAIFNLVPIPPLDGSKILFNLLSSRFYKIEIFLEQYSLILVFVFIVFFADYLYPILAFLFKAFTGLAI